MVLNDIAARNAKQGIIWDTNLKGFGLRVGKQTKTWLVLVGSGRRKRIGRYPFMSAAQAREHAKKVLAQKTLGSIVPKVTRFDDAREEYLKDCVTRLRPKTLKSYTWMLKQFDFGRRNLADITGYDLLKVMNRQTESVKEHLYRVSRSFFVWCFRNHLIDRLPTERLDPPPAGKVRERVLTDEELATVYRVALEGSNQVAQLVFLLIRTGQRPGEIRQLKRAYIAPDRITLPSELTKNKKEHTFPISEETYKFIQEVPEVDDSPYLFPPGRSHVRGKKVHVTSLSHPEDFMEECRIAKWQLRDLRKTFATGLQKLGVPIPVTEAFLNHTQTRAGIVGVYQRHHYFPEMQLALSQWDRHLEKLLD